MRMVLGKINENEKLSAERPALWKRGMMDGRRSNKCIFHKNVNMLTR